MAAMERRRQRTAQTSTPAGAGTLNIGSWNTRGLGDPHGQCDQAVKLAALCRCWEAWGWDMTMPCSRGGGITLGCVFFA